MPVVEVHFGQGLAPEARSRLTPLLRQAVRSVISAPDEAITVVFQEDGPQTQAPEGGCQSADQVRSDPGELVLRYLRHMEARDLPAAKALLSDEFQMVFPGTAPMRTVEELVAWAAPRYRFVTKAYDGVDTVPGDGAAVVYTRGTLSGEWPDGTPFSGIRFIDRFEVREGKIARQDVWNDIAEVRPQ